ncbi:Uma2 family endonuclease [Pannus brasiliensis CCIBt3594]|uniref:Uma2 family endonuclease n=1 Tax=Pannus brasiliensis CCIBt3594 TaxID=1427578 RepID=A0AAW9QQF9_9CHRO
MSQLQQEILADTWVKATWEEYLQAIEQVDRSGTYYKSYYSDGYYRLEMTPIGNDHACDHTIVVYTVNLYGTLKNLDFQGRDNCSYRKMGVREVQPDASYYFGSKADIIPYGTSIIDLDVYPAPDLVIEVSNTTIADDLGNKRLLYEELGVSEYWVVDVVNARVIAFAMLERGSQRVDISRGLPGLSIALVTEALQRSRENNHGIVARWLLEQFQLQT